MLVLEPGPGRVLEKFRELTGVHHDANGKAESWNDYTPFHCTCCASVWVAAALYFAPSWLHKLLAASAVSVLLDNVPDVIEASRLSQEKDAGEKVR